MPPRMRAEITASRPARHQGSGLRAQAKTREPATIASMKALISHGTPMLGATLDNGVINAPASAAKPRLHKGHPPHAVILDAEAAHEILVHHHGAR